MCVSGVAFRNVSCVIFRRLEKKKLGTTIVSRCNGNIEHAVVMSCVDDSDFCTIAEHSENIMQQIITWHTKMRETAGGKVHAGKVLMHCWKWYNQKIKIILIKINLKYEKIK